MMVARKPDDLDAASPRNFVMLTFKKLWNGMSTVAQNARRFTAWRNARSPLTPIYDGTIAGLIEFFQTDPDSPFHKKRYATRDHYKTLCRHVANDCGTLMVRDLKARDILRLHEQWSAGGKVTMGHGMIGMLRIVTNFGATFLDNEDCRKLAGILKMRFKMAKPRTERLTADQAMAVIARAHKKRQHSIALAQAFQYEGFLRQKDVIGEWVPLDEPVEGIVSHGEWKWLRGILWSEIDAKWHLRHVTSKRDKPIDIDLTLAPMVVAELRRLAGLKGEEVLTRDMLPAVGPIVICERTGLPYRSADFRGRWRILANACGIPKNVRNMDSRAGRISEASDAGAELEHIRHAATHSNSSTTARYSRNPVEKTAAVMRKCIEHRAQQQMALPPLAPPRGRSTARRKANPTPRAAEQLTQAPDQNKDSA
jgi:hypothetical protein